MHVSVQVTVDAPINTVWDSYTLPAHIVNWNFASNDWHTPRASVDLRVGGNFSSRMEAKDGSEGFDFEGTYTEIIEHEFIEYTFGDRLAQVSFAEEEDGVRVVVTFETEDENSAEDQRNGWQAILNNFAAYVRSL